MSRLPLFRTFKSIRAQAAHLLLVREEPALLVGLQSARPRSLSKQAQPSIPPGHRPIAWMLIQGLRKRSSKEARCLLRLARAVSDPANFVFETGYAGSHAVLEVP